jgi:putative oxidoreductase
MSPENGTASWLSCTDGAATRMQDLWILVARVTFGLIFVVYGWPKLMNISGFAAGMPARGLPVFLGYLAPFVEFFGGLFIVFGFATRYSALLLIAFVLIATFSSHRYWDVDPAQYGAQKINFFKNIAILSGGIVLFVTGGGKYAVDAMLGRKS